MSRIAIVSDSSVDLPHELINKWNITVVPLGVSFSDGKQLNDLTHEEFYTSLKNSSELPTTAQATPAQLQSVYAELLKDHEHIISIHISSKLSGTVKSAHIAKDMVDPERITVIDSKVASLGQGMLAIVSAEMATSGASVSEIVTALTDRISKQYAVFTIDVLDNLVKGGRLSSAQGLLGSMLKIKPILWISNATEGRIEPLDKVRGRRRALKQLIEIAREKGYNLSEQRLGISHSLADDITEFAALVKQELNPKEIVISRIGPVIGTHVGKGTIAFFFTGK